MFFLGIKRVFLAIKLPKNLLDSIALFQDKIKKIGLDAKFVEKKNLHVNLKFFGSIEDENVEDIVKAVEEVLKKVRKFKIEIKSSGVFPNKNFIRVVWAGIGNGKQKLKELHSGLEKEFSNLGFPKDERDFFPHLTLCRVHSQKNIKQLRNAVEDNREKFFGEFYVDSIFLIQSKLSPKGPIYIPLKKFEFGD